MNRRILVTGASSGIGRAVADMLALEGASLALVARSEERLAKVASELPGGPHDVFALDVLDEDGWRNIGGRVAPEGRLHGVVAAAAQLAPIGPPGTWTVAEFRHTLEVNVVGTLLPVLANLEALRSVQGSVVTFSGGGATSPFPNFDAYATSKAAVVRLTENLAEELAESAVRVNAVAPGFIVTRIHDATVEAGPELVGREYYERTQRALEDGDAQSPTRAAELTSFLLSDAAAGISGKLLSAQWDPWHEPAFQERLRSEKDLATLRRIDDQFYTSARRPADP